jgi:DNA invertase Pin-like site-specific DNA recombinase
LLNAPTRDSLPPKRKVEFGGRPRVMDLKKTKTARTLYESGNHTVAEIAAMLGVGTATVYRHLSKDS